MPDKRMEEGFPTTYTFGADSTVKIWEKEVQPPGYSGGGGISLTSMRNSAVRTMGPKKLVTVTDANAKVAYAASALSSVRAMVNVNQQITVTFEEGSTLVIWGFIDDFTPDAMKEGEEPSASIKIIVSNLNASGVETQPVFTDNS